MSTTSWCSSSDRSLVGREHRNTSGAQPAPERPAQALGCERPRADQRRDEIAIRVLGTYDGGSRLRRYPARRRVR